MARPALERVSQREYARRLGVSNEAVSKAVAKGWIKKGWDPKEKKIIVSHANAEWGELHLQQQAKNIVPGPAPSTNNHDDAIPHNDSGTLSSNTSYANAKRVKEIAQAQLTVLDLKKKKGELVERDLVYKQLFKHGQILRTVLMGIPDKCIDDIIAAKSRSEAHLVMTTALHNALEAATSKQIELMNE
ncbi:hypothetical protein [Chitinophaga sp. CF418]|uniref:hypothetical protein n=1 Tax=Chitinophaga sp. CF418 TaxID=1855287 RepID=UPI0009198BF1|nr:hypothetical protein [Chitinophaga sp. CF418]SHN42264.1 hypothetical protein SAMN05216311_114159 [Chitinophaga sp. CF418]